jgi:ABC-2 type transporter
MRYHILRTLFVKELQRHVANRGGIALGLLLVAAAILLSVFNPAGIASGGATANEADGANLIGGVHHCFLIFPREDPELMTPLLDHLQTNVPPELKQRIVFRPVEPNYVSRGIPYETGIGSIRLSVDSTGKSTKLKVQIYHPPGEVGAMAIYEQWLWRELRVGLEQIASIRAAKLGITPPKTAPIRAECDDLWAIRESFERLQQDYAQRKPSQPNAELVSVVPDLVIIRQGLGGKVLELRTAIATGLVVFALYFTCVYLLPTLNCEERERGVLLAQALSPASPTEILLAKFLFYPMIGGGLAATIAGVYKPSVLSTLFFWSSLFSVACGFLGIGMTIATLAKTQRAAFMGAMCYLMSVSLLLVICSSNGIPLLSNLALEYHVPRVLHASLSGTIQPVHWLHLIAALALASCWLLLAGWLFRIRGWQ